MDTENSKKEKPLRWLSALQLILALTLAVVTLITLALGQTDKSTKDMFALIRNTPALHAMTIITLILFVLLIITTILEIYYVARLRKSLLASEEYYREEAKRDDLTGLFNRRAASEYIRSIPEGAEFTAIIMNVDKFKDINEIYGHDFGDHVLQVIARELLNYMKAYNGYVARFGSDEFLIIFRERRLSENSDEITHMRDIIHEPIKIGLANIIPTVCIGAAQSDGRSKPEQIVEHAEIAEHDSKQHGRKSFTMFSENLQDKIQKSMDVKVKIRDAIQNDGLYMVFQPKVDAQTRETVGYEALVRMRDHNISPAEFIPVAEENGWLREIGRITTQKTIEQIAAWRKQDPSYNLPVSINFSSVQIRDAGYFYFLLDMLTKYQVPSYLVEIEITERVMLEYTKETAALMNRFHAAGMRLAMDDFGTGYSSLSYLSQFPMDILKIDRSFVAANILDAKKRSLIRDMIRMGHDLNLQIVVEGVETKEQYTYIREMGADIIQGFYFSKPLPADEAIAFRAGEEK